jgi:peptide/nickel transport system substrate-binding protein
MSIPYGCRRGVKLGTWLGLWLPLALSLGFSGMASGGAEGRGDAEGMVLGVQYLPPHLNPLIQVGHSVQMLAPQLFASPLRFDAEGRAVPYLAETWSVSADGRQVTLRLREGTRFHDGEPITSADVAFSLLALREHHPFRDFYQAIEAVDTPDPGTAILRLRHPHPMLETLLSPVFCPILPRHVFYDGTPLLGHPANGAPVGSGPFRVQRVELPRWIELERNPDFFLADRPRLQRLVFRGVGIEEDMALLLIHGHLDGMRMVHRSSAGFEELRRLPWMRIWEDADHQLKPTVNLQLNLSRPPLEDVRVRRAIQMALDVPRMVGLLSQGEDKVLRSLLGHGDPFHSEMDGIRHDPIQANTLLDQAGYAKDQNGIRFSLVLGYLPADKGMETATDYLAYELQRLLGIEVIRQRSASLEEWAGLTLRQQFDLNLLVSLLYSDPMMGMHRLIRSRPANDDSPFTNNTGYANPELDRLLDLARREMDPERRRALYAEVLGLLEVDVPLIALSRPNLHTLTHQGLRGLHPRIGLMAPFDEVHWQAKGD